MQLINQHGTSAKHKHNVYFSPIIMKENQIIPRPQKENKSENVFGHWTLQQNKTDKQNIELQVVLN